MSWEVRRGCRNRYYTRSYTVAGKLTRFYIGLGPEAETLAAEDAQRQAEQKAERLVRRQDEEQWTVAEQPLLAMGKVTDLLTGMTLVLAGYFRHGGEWRIRA